MKLVWKYLHKHLGIFLLSTLFLTLEAMADLLQPTFMSHIVDNGVKQADIRKNLRLWSGDVGDRAGWGGFRCDAELLFQPHLAVCGQRAAQGYVSQCRRAVSGKH